MYVNSANYPPKPETITQKNLHYILAEIEENWKVSAHKMTTSISSNESFPPQTTVIAYIAKGNSLRIDVVNFDDKSKHSSIRPQMRNKYTYPTWDSSVKSQSKKTLQLLTADPDSVYVIQQKSTDDGDRERFTFIADDTPRALDSYDDRALVPHAYHQRTPAPPKSTDEFYTKLSKLREVKESIITKLYNKDQISSEEVEILLHI